MTSFRHYLRAFSRLWCWWASLRRRPGSYPPHEMRCPIANLVTITAVFAVEINVSPGAGTIQAALNSASSGDELVLADGTYTGATTINKDITIRAANAGLAVLDGQNKNSERVIYMSSGNLFLTGLAVTRGLAGDRSCGGVCVHGGTVTMNGGAISNCHHQYAWGSGLKLEGGSTGTFNDVVIKDSTATRGIIWVGGGSTADFNGCEVKDNNSYEWGTIILTGTGSPVKFAHTLFSNNDNPVIFSDYGDQELTIECCPSLTSGEIVLSAGSMTNLACSPGLPPGAPPDAPPTPQSPPPLTGYLAPQLCRRQDHVWFQHEVQH